MNISFENPDKINGRLTMVVEEADYKDDMEKTLKDYRKRANIPGFRPGQAPMSMIKRQFGPSVKMDAINRLMGESLDKYLKDNNISMLGEPLAAEDQEPQDLEKPAPYTFVFDIAVAPEFKVELTGRDKVDYYDIKVGDEMIQEQVDAFASRAGEYKQVDEYADKDMLKGDLRELNEDGSVKEGGITVEGAVLMPSYIKVEEEKKRFDGVKKGDIVVFNPKKAYPESDVEIASLLKLKKEEVADITADFSLHVQEITRYEAAPVDQTLFDKIYGEGVVQGEEAFRQKIAEGIKEQLVSNSDFQFLRDVRKHCEKKVGKLEYPEALLKRIMKQKNTDKAENYVDEHFDKSIEELNWQLIKSQLVEANEIKVEDQDVRNAAMEQARFQFVQYGMGNVPDEYLVSYVDEMLKKRENIDNFVERAIDVKLTQKLKEVVKLKVQEVSFDEFQKIVNPEA